MALSKSYTDTRAVMGRGVSESVRVPDTSAVKNQGKSWPADMSSAVRQEIYEIWLLSVSQNYVDFRQWGKMAWKLKFRKN